MANTSEITDDIIERLEQLNTVRDLVLADSRQIVRHSANAIRAAHRGEADNATQELQHAREMITHQVQALSPYPSLKQAGYAQDAMKEYAEASITLAILERRAIPGPGELQVEDAPYLNGLAEAASELRRDVLDGLRFGSLDRAEALIEIMDDIYSALVTVDYPDALTGGLRRTTDALRAVLERTRADLTLTQSQERLRATINEALLASERSSETPTTGST